MKRLCQGAKEALAHIRAYPISPSDGLRHIGRAALAKRTERCPRMVSYYLDELVAHGHLEVVAPRRRYYPGKGWRCIGVNGYRLRGDTAQPRPAMPRPRHNRRSPRGAMNCTTPLILRGRGGPPAPASPQTADQNWQNTPAPDPEQVLAGVGRARAQLRRARTITE